MLPFPQLVREGVSVAVEDQVRRNGCWLSLGSWKQKSCETHGYLGKEVKAFPRQGQQWST